MILLFFAFFPINKPFEFRYIMYLNLKRPLSDFFSRLTLCICHITINFCYFWCPGWVYFLLICSMGRASYFAYVSVALRNPHGSPCIPWPPMLPFCSSLGIHSPHHHGVMLPLQPHCGSSPTPASSLFSRLCLHGCVSAREAPCFSIFCSRPV